MLRLLRVLVAKFRKTVLTVAKRARKNQIPVITIPKKKKTAKTIAPLAKPAVRDLFSPLF
ncbi:hypothetical protein [Epilithonimonas mollis]|uniref:hypothetical protein n=1 Tax=Epilithonimonas mollis TaxID=216903 RepID=UPI0011148FDC|nr:hypothetical protein [Epilithonimonas mollis]